MFPEIVGWRGNIWWLSQLRLTERRCLPCLLDIGAPGCSVSSSLLSGELRRLQQEIDGGI